MKWTLGMGVPSPTQTRQRSGKLIAKGGISPTGYGKLYFARSGEPSRAASQALDFHRDTLMPFGKNKVIVYAKSASELSA